MGCCYVSIALVLFLVGKAGGSVCSNSTDLHNRIANSVGPDGRPTPFLDTLRGTIDDVLTDDESQFLLDAIDPSKYKAGSGYDSSNYGVHASNIKQSSSLSGLELSLLASPKTGFSTKGEYERYLTIREKIRRITEEQLGLCPGTLRIDFSHLSQKGKGGKHNPHADNCFHKFESRQMVDADTREVSIIKVPVCDPTISHPFPTRVAASIVFINDKFGGGEFYWAGTEMNEPAILVKPKPGRMTYFSAGPENLHGALPVENAVAVDTNDAVCHGTEENGSDTCSALPSPRRIYLALWYVDDTQPGEAVPVYREGNDISEDGTTIDDPNGPTKVLQLPVKAIKPAGLKLALSFFLLALQNKPSKGTWRFVQEDVPLGMLFKDGSAMFSIRLTENSVIIERHTDYNKRPSLLYQLQESLALHRVLDELHSLSLGPGNDEYESIREEDKLIQFKNPDIIEEARKSLPARSA